MKKCLICLFMITIVCFGLFSEEDDRNFTIQTSPGLYVADIVFLGLGSPFLMMDLEGQYKINDFLNISLALSFLIDFKDFGGTNYQVHIKPMLIFRPLRTGLKGFFIGLYPVFGFTDYAYTTQISMNGGRNFYYEVGGGVNAGYKWVFRNGFTLQLGGGVGKSFLLPHTGGIMENLAFTSDGRMLLPPIDIGFDFKIGYSF